MHNGWIKLIAKFRTNFVTGMFTFLPLALTLYLVFFLGIKINAFVISITPYPLKPLLQDASYGLFLRLLVVLFLVCLIALLGAITKFYIGNRLLAFGNRLLIKIPIFNKIYTSIKQVVKAVFGQKKRIFKKVVLIAYPRPGIYSLGFLTGTARGEIQVKTQACLHNIFVPTTPNPTSGMLVMVIEEDITYLDMTVEEGMKLIISGGAVTPDYIKK